MQKYIGTKMIQATPMTRGQYNAYRHWTVPADENPADEGYLVEYLDGGKANHDRHNGYITWSPAEQFNNAYHSIHSGMSFGHALVALEAGERVARVGWNGKGMWLILVIGDEGPANHDIDYIIRDDEEGHCDGLKRLPWLGMKTADGGFVPWLASQTDMLARDWCVIPSESAPLGDDPGYDAELRDVVITSPIDVANHDLYLQGLIFNDRRQRFPDGKWVTTSKVAVWNEADSIATTESGTRYKVLIKAVGEVKEKLND